MPYVYTNQALRKRIPHEQALIDAGYPWVSQTSLRAFAPLSDSPQMFSLPDRLIIHKHHSLNTHLIVQNSLELCPWYPNQPEPNIDQPLHGIRLTANDYSLRNKERTIPPLQCYVGKAGRRDCKFVEGHLVLSPDTADRFEQRGDIKWVDGGQDEEAWFTEETHRGQYRDQPKKVPDHVLRRLYPRRS